MDDRGKLGGFLREVIDWRWDEFCVAEADDNYKGFESVVFSLVRACSGGKLGAIKQAIDRIDGKVATPVKVEYPKVYLLYPHASRVALPSGSSPTTDLSLPDPNPSEPPSDLSPATDSDKPDLATMSLRQTLTEMADEPRVLVDLVLARKQEVEVALKRGEPIPDEGVTVPLVKSVIAANLLNLARNSKFEAITEVFDQIDGKLVETLKVLGADIYLTEYALEAPAGAVKNKDGVYMIGAEEVAERWKKGFKKD